MNWDNKDLAAYLKISPGDVKKYASSEPEKKKGIESKLKPGKDSPEAINCQKNFANYSLSSSKGIVCTYTKYCTKQSTDAMTRIKRCTDPNKK